MSLEVKVGPPQISVNQGYTVMVSEPDGQVEGGSQKGLFFLDTRLISVWSLSADGVPWKLLNGGALAASAARVYCTNSPVLTAHGIIPENSLGLEFGRHIDHGMHEDFVITNFGSKAVSFNLELSVRSDFADLFEVKDKRVARRGRIETCWNAPLQELVTTYTNSDFSRSIRIVGRSDSPINYANGRLNFGVELEPGAVWDCCLLYDFSDGTAWQLAPVVCVKDYLQSEAPRAQKVWQDSVLKIETTCEAFSKSFRQSVDDMAALRLPIEGTDEVSFVPAAGLPWFVALFGRDSLIISLQNAIVHPQFAFGALQVLADWQAKTQDDYRDAEPGKIHHELRRGELAHFKLVPHTPYYGTADATPLYLITLHSAWLSTGDLALLHRHLATAEQCLAWIDHFGDRDGDGFQEYQTRSPVGYENQGWKDSGNSVMNVDGSLVAGPKALCELQGYVYDAWLRMADIYSQLGRPAAATALREKAAELYVRFNERFWNEAEGYYAYALDGNKRQVLSIASNPGQCLWSGIIPVDRARRVADRLMQDDMWSGWGIRTLSATHKSFNPYDYQTGAVWPHDNGFIALGMKRYGFHDEANRIASAVTRASSFFAMNQLPELYAGIQADPTNFPIQYVGANVPQGWAAGSVFSLLQAILGLQADAPNQRLYLDPALPDWMPQLIVRDLQVGQIVFDIKFSKTEVGTTYEVLRGPAEAVRTRAVSVWASELASGRRIADSGGH